jgi:hypothetical protein
MATAIGDLVARLRMDTKGFAGPLARANGAVLQTSTHMRKFGHGALEIGRRFTDSAKTVAIGAGIVGAAVIASTAKLAHSVMSEMKVMDEIGKHAQRLNMATEALVGLQHQAELSGAGAEGLDKSMRKMMQSIGEVAAFGTGQAKYAFKELQLDPKKLIGMSPEQQYGAIADALLKVEAQTTRVAIATQIFGRSGADMLVMLQQGSAGMNAAARDAEYLGLTFSAIDSQKIEMANDEWYRMKSALTGLIRELAVRFAPIMGTVANIVADFFVEWRRGIEQMPAGTSGWIRSLQGVGSTLNQILISYHEIEAMDVRMKIAQKRAFGAPTSEINELSQEYGGHLRRIRELQNVDWNSRVEDTFHRIANAVGETTRDMGTFQDDLDELAERFKPANDAAKLFNDWLREAVQFDMTDRQKQIDNLLAAGAPTIMVEALHTADKALGVLEKHAEDSRLAKELNQQFSDPIDAYVERIHELERLKPQLDPGVFSSAIEDAKKTFEGAYKDFESTVAGTAGAMTAGSAEAYSTIVQGYMRGSQQNRQLSAAQQIADQRLGIERTANTAIETERKRHNDRLRNINVEQMQSIFTPKPIEKAAPTSQDVSGWWSRIRRDDIAESHTMRESRSLNRQAEFASPANATSFMFPTPGKNQQILDATRIADERMRIERTANAKIESERQRHNNLIVNNATPQQTVADWWSQIREDTIGGSATMRESRSLQRQTDFSTVDVSGTAMVKEQVATRKIIERTNGILERIARQLAMSEREEGI